MKKGLKRMDDKAFILSKKFRTAIERAKREGEFDSDPTLKHFPKACCGSASSLLAKFLYENGIYTYEINATKHGEISWDNQSHTWLMLENGCILDITGDQFKSDEEFLCYSERVYYGEIDEFHQLFDYAKSDIYEYRDCTEIARKVGQQYSKMYNAILAYIKQEDRKFAKTAYNQVCINRIREILKEFLDEQFVDNHEYCFRKSPIQDDLDVTIWKKGTFEKIFSFHVNKVHF